MAGQVSAGLAALQLRVAQRNSSDFQLDVSTEILPGITILFGPSGAGKSTLLDCIAGLVRPDTGKIKIGEDTLFDSESSINLPTQRRRIAYVFQSLALFPHMTVKENVAYGLGNLDARERSMRLDEVLQAFHVDKIKTRRPGEISGGEKQRVALARSLVTLPRVLLLDEPLSGLDAELKSFIVDDLRAWNAAQKIPIVYVTHAREEVEALGERVIVLDQGRVVSEGYPHAVLSAPRRRKLAQALGFENVFSGTVIDQSKTDGVTRVRLEESATEIEVPLGYEAPNDRVRIAIRAGDIMLANQRPQGLSARNILEGKISGLEQRGTTVVACIQSGAKFIAHLTPNAARSLGLALGSPVWIVLKTHSCHLVSD